MVMETVNTVRVLIDFDNYQEVVVGKDGEEKSLEEYIKQEVRKALDEVTE